MKINNINNNESFTSAFKFNSISKDCYNELRMLANHESRKIYNNVSEKGDVVFISHPCYNERVKNFIDSKNLKFEYFPNIFFSDNLTIDTLRTLINRDKKQNKTIKNSFLLNAQIVKDNITRGQCIFKHLKYICKTLRLNIDNPEISVSKNGLPKIRDNSKERTIYVSSNYGSKYYVYVKPDSSNIDSARYLLFGNGRKFIKEYKSPEDISRFQSLSCIVSD